MRQKMRAVAVATLLGTLLAVPSAAKVVADGSEALGPASVTLAAGTGMMSAGVGLIDGQPDSFTVTVPGEVRQVLLYWSCHYQAPQVGDPTISVNGIPVTGKSIGGPTIFAADVEFQDWRADITALGLVAEGANTLTISGLDCQYGGESSADGAGVIVIYDEAGKPPATMELRDGLDLAFFYAAPDRQTTTPQTFTFAASASDREATLVTLAASVQGPASGETPIRPNFLRVTFDVGDPVVFEYPWASAEGNEFDAVDLAVTIPAGATTLTVEALSIKDPNIPWLVPASFAWIGAGLSFSSFVENPGIDIRKQVEGPDSRTVLTESTVTFEIQVTNTGNVPLTGVVVTDAQAPNCAKTIGDLAVGQVVTYTCTVPNVTAGFTNTACVKGYRNAMKVEDCDDSTVVVEKPAIDIRKQAEGPDTRTVVTGSTVTFEIAVKNTGDVPLTGVVVTDAQAPNCAKTIGNLAVGQVATYTCTVPNVTAGFTNTACVKGYRNATKVEDCDPSTVTVSPPPVCTRTLGYWKTHSEFGPAKYDSTWKKVGSQGAKTAFFGTGQSWYTVMNTAPAGNAYYILAHQYAAAVLNQLAGSNTSTITTTLARAKVLLDQYDGKPQPMSAITGSVRDEFVALAGILDQYNNGQIGPGHCG